MNTTAERGFYDSVVAVDMVMPCIARDLDRLQLYLASRRKFWHVPGRFFLCVPNKDLDLFRALAEEHRLELVTKESVISTKPYEGATAIGGWYRQQLVKLGGAAIVDTPFYMALDSDMFHARHVERAGDLLRDGKLPWYMKSFSDPTYAARLTLCRTFAQHYAGASLPDDFAVSMWQPPFVFDRAVLRTFLATDWVTLLCEHRKVRGYGWGEAYVYRVLAHLQGMWDDRHAFGGPVTHEFIRHPWVDIEGDFEAWRPADTFSGAWLFGVVHSNTQIPVSRTHDKLASFFDC